MRPAHKGRAQKNTRDARYPRVAIAEQLDQAVRRCQRQETHGSPIGPDTSLILAELLLAAADAEWVSKLPNGARATRLVDDYRVGTQTRSDADQVLADIGAALQRVGLTLNPKKSRVVELPAPIDAPWVTTLKSLLRDGLQPSARQQRRDLLCVFDTAASLARSNPDAHVFAYALSLIRSMAIRDTNWPLAQNLLFQIAVAEPGVLPRVLLELLWHSERQGFALDVQRLRALL